MRIISFLLLLTYSLSLNGETKNPFLNLKFDKVLIYDYDFVVEGDPSIVDDKGQLSKSIKKEVQLDKAVIDKLNLKLGDKKSYGNITAMCFEPHLGIVYYLKDKIAGYVSICLDCNGLRANIDIPAQKQNKRGQAEKVYYLGDGMSKSFRQFINDLLKKYGFSHQIKSGSDFDK